MSAVAAFLLAALCIPCGLAAALVESDRTAVIAGMAAAAFLSSALLLGMTP